MIGNNKSLVMSLVLFVITSIGANQAYALNDDEAAVLMGLAVGGITAYAVKHHREHDRNDWSAAPARRPSRHPDPYAGRDWDRHGDHRGGHHGASYSRPFHSRVVIIDNSRGRGHGHRHGHGHHHGPGCRNIRW